MKKLIAILLIVVMGLCVVGTAEGFERQEDISIESEDVKSNMDEIALQLEDFDLSIDEDCLYETDIEEMYTKSEADAKINTSTDFDIRDGVLVKYNGAGGDVVIPNGVHSIGRRAFSQCQDITRVVVPDSVTDIGEDAFVWCKSLKTINIPGGVTNIGECAFLNCGSLNEIVIPDSVLEIGNQAFEGCISLESASIGNGLRKLTYSIFSNCTSLERVSIGRNVASIDENAFEYCESLERITLPYGVSRIEVHAFAGCKNLFSIVIPDSVTSIEEYAFDECPNLTIYGESKSYAEKYAKENGIPFKKCSSSEQGLTIDQGEKATLYMGNKLTLTTNYDGNLKWKSSKKDVATVSTKGVVTPKKAGTTIITVKAGNNNKAQITIKVVDAKSIEITQGEKVTMTVGDILTLRTKITPSEVKSKLAWGTSNSKVVAVDKDGNATAKTRGKATITVKTSNGKKANCDIVVNENNAVKYRALLIGQTAFDPVCNRNKGDVELMEKMLKSVKGPAGGSYNIKKLYDLSGKSVLNAIADTFRQADSNDVSLFFIATHGDTEHSGKQAGALSMPIGESLLLEDLANGLNKVPGSIIVFIQSCGSGAAIYSNGNNRDKMKAFEESAVLFDKSVIDIFTDIDHEITIGEESSNEMNPQSNTGEFRIQNKFYVLTASRYQEESWGNESELLNYNYFTKWLTKGIGKSGKMPADKDKDGITTLMELYNYISKKGDNKGLLGPDLQLHYQHVQVYPEKSKYKLFARQ